MMERWRGKLTGSYAWVLFVAPKLPVIEVINDGSGGKRLAPWQPERKRPSGGDVSRSCILSCGQR